MKLDTLTYKKGSRNHKRKTYGRGFGSGIGKTSGKGTKGQKARKSGKVRLGFEGGQTPLYRKIPKVGFNNYNFSNDYQVITLSQIVKSNITDFSLESLKQHKLIKDVKKPIKLIGGSKDLKLTKPVKITVNKASKSIIDIVKNAGGEVIIK